MKKQLEIKFKTINAGFKLCVIPTMHAEPMRLKKFAVISICALTLTTGCSSGSTYSGNSSEQHPCEVLKANYFSEYQAYVDARAANNGVEDEAVMSHYYASGEYAIQFSEADCENQGFSLDESDPNGTSESDSSGDEYLESEITEVILKIFTTQILIILITMTN